MENKYIRELLHEAATEIAALRQERASLQAKINGGGEDLVAKLFRMKEDLKKEGRLALSKAASDQGFAEAAEEERKHGK